MISLALNIVAYAVVVLAAWAGFCLFVLMPLAALCRLASRD